ncbi:MAG: hypothetical protein HYS12_15250 [Planctomycetes bacterium]|nr:hypothetical protein [Planctomycetota bacterium]
MWRVSWGSLPACQGSRAPSLSVSAPGVLSNDSDSEGDTLTAVLVSGPSHGSLTLNSNGSFSCHRLRLSPRTPPSEPCSRCCWGRSCAPPRRGSRPGKSPFPCRWSCRAASPSSNSDN